MKSLTSTFFALAVLSLSCKKNIDISEERTAPENFNFANTKDIVVNVKVLTGNDQPLRYTLVKFYYPDNDIPYEAVYKGLTDSSGVLKGSFVAPARRQEIAVDVIYPGIRRNVIFEIKDGNLNATIGGPNSKMANKTFRNDPAPSRLLDVWVDTDGDGVSDASDEFPTDPAKVYTLYYPAKGSYATLAFEDNWPKKGDSDMNDLVVKYNYAMVCNKLNNYVDITGKFKVVAAGAMNNNGFGVIFLTSACSPQT